LFVGGFGLMKIFAVCGDIDLKAGDVNLN